jgi:hypothetical protein
MDEKDHQDVYKNERKADGETTWKALQDFKEAESDHHVGYSSGKIILQPKGVKDSESVGLCTQYYTVCCSQPKALEVAYGDPDEPDGELVAATVQRLLLGPGDTFRIRKSFRNDRLSTNLCHH